MAATASESLSGVFIMRLNRLRNKQADDALSTYSSNATKLVDTSKGSQGMIALIACYIQLLPEGSDTSENRVRDLKSQ